MPTNVRSDINAINTRLAGLPTAITVEEFAVALAGFLIEYPSSPVFDLGERYKYAGSLITQRVLVGIHNDLNKFLSKLEFTPLLKSYLTNVMFSEVLYDAIFFEEGLLSDINPNIKSSNLSFSM